MTVAEKQVQLVSSAPPSYLVEDLSTSLGCSLEEASLAFCHMRPLTSKETPLLPGLLPE